MVNRTKVQAMGLTFFTIFLAIFMLTGCGQKRPLYLEPVTNNTPADSELSSASTEQGKD